jgi:hypothetical protein
VTWSASIFPGRIWPEKAGGELIVHYGGATR